MDDLKLYGKSEAEIESISIQRGNVAETEGLQLESGTIIKSLDQDGNYKFLGILQSENIQYKTVKTTS